MITAYFFSGKNKNTSAPKQLLEAGPVDSFGLNTVSAFMGGRFYLAQAAGRRIYCTFAEVYPPGMRRFMGRKAETVHLPLPFFSL